jgi:hypothetical protein
VNRAAAAARVSAPLAFALALVVTGCSDAISLGPDPDLVWWTDFESCAPADFAVNWQAGGGQLTAVNSPARSGRCAIRSEVVPQPAGTISGAQLIDPGPLPADAYESTWFFVPDPIGTVQYWVFFKLGSRTVVDDPATGVDVWDFNLQPTASGGLEVAIIPRLADLAAPAALGDPSVPIGRWFQVESHFRASPGDDGVLQLWLDDTLLFEARGFTAPTAAVGWSIGGGCEQLTSPAATMNIDDAAIAKRRLGPQFPVFTRAR